MWLAHGVLGGEPDTAGHAFFVAPLYVYFLAGALAVLRSGLAVRLLQIVLGTVAVWLIYRTARDWFGERAALLSAALAECRTRRIGANDGDRRRASG